MMLVLSLGAAMAVQPAEPVQPVTVSDFELTASPPNSSGDDVSPLVPERPRNLDTRDFAVDAPEAELRLAVDGPVLAIGAMGGRRSGRPKLAHIALDWSF
jgi:hypothetical protein